MQPINTRSGALKHRLTSGGVSAASPRSSASPHSPWLPSRPSSSRSPRTATHRHAKTRMDELAQVRGGGVVDLH